MDAPTYNSARLQAVLFFALAALLVAGRSVWAREQPKLVLQITVDALRGDLPSRFNNVLGTVGFAI